MRSKDRVRSLGEVFTPPEMVKTMLDNLPFSRIDERTFEPGVGSGNFQVAILERKLLFLDRPPRNEPEALAFDIFVCLSSMYGTDIDEQNVDETRSRLLDLAMSSRHFERLDVNLQKKLHEVLSKVVGANFIVCDMLGDLQKVEIPEYGLTQGDKVKVKIYPLAELLFPTSEVFGKDSLLFGHVPHPSRELPLMPYFELVGADL